MKRKKAKSNSKKNEVAPVKSEPVAVKDEITREIEESEIFVVLTPKEAAAAMHQSRRSFDFDESRIRSFEKHEREVSVGLTKKPLSQKKSQSKSPKKQPQIVAESSDIVLPDIRTIPPPKPMQELIEDDSTANSATYVVSSTIVNETVYQSKSNDILEEDDLEEHRDENKPPTTNKANQSSYDMTGDKIFLPSTEENYVVDDLSSGDETDDENNPRKQVPKWAKSRFFLFVSVIFFVF